MTIQDNDAIPTVSWASSSFSAAEAVGTTFLSVQLSTPSSSPVTVAFATSNGTAVAGIAPSGDYTAAGYTITFAPGEADKTVRVSITSDANPEPNETINLALSSPTNATLGTASAVLTIVDDDAAPPQQPPNGYDILATYDTIGNLTSKSDVGAYTYGNQSASCPDGVWSKPHAVVAAGAKTFCYDKIGNMTTRNGDYQSWTTANLPNVMARAGAVDAYTYDGDGVRLQRITTAQPSGQVTTTNYAEGGVFERDTGATRPSAASTSSTARWWPSARPCGAAPTPPSA